VRKGDILCVPSGGLSVKESSHDGATASSPISLQGCLYASPSFCLTAFYPSAAHQVWGGGAHFTDEEARSQHAPPLPRPVAVIQASPSPAQFCLLRCDNGLTFPFWQVVGQSYLSSTSFFFFFVVLGFGLQGLRLLRKALYPLSHSTSPVLCWVFLR
jgi:hypothetical protein